MKKILSLAAAVVMTLALMIPAVFAEEAEFTMYVYTQNGGVLNVRAQPSKSAEVVGGLEYGEAVTVYEIMGSTGWARINYFRYGVAYVQSRFLVSEPPAPRRTAAPTAAPDDKQRELDALNHQLGTLRSVEPFYVVVHPSRASGWVNFRVGPGTGASRITSFGEGKQLLVFGETNNWYHARDPETGREGYISKNYCSPIPMPAVTVEGDSTEQLGSLNVNGEFSLQCRVPAGYKLQVVNMMGTRIVASITSETITSPVLYLSIAFDETYASVDRMNDMSEEQLAALQGSFTEMNQVEISYRETSHGTKLMVARETGSDTDFVDILTIYKGYSIEFVMTPNPNAASQTLTEEQIQMCVDFLSDLDFVPVR